MTLPVFSPNSKRLGFAGRHDKTWQLVLDNKTLIQDADDVPAIPIVFSPDSANAAWVIQKGQQYLFTVDDRHWPPIDALAISTLTFSPIRGTWPPSYKPEPPGRSMSTARRFPFHRHRFLPSVPGLRDRQAHRKAVHSAPLHPATRPVRPILLAAGFHRPRLLCRLRRRFLATFLPVARWLDGLRIPTLRRHHEEFPRFLA